MRTGQWRRRKQESGGRERWGQGLDMTQTGQTRTWVPMANVAHIEYCVLAHCASAPPNLWHHLWTVKNIGHVIQTAFVVDWLCNHWLFRKEGATGILWRMVIKGYERRYGSTGAFYHSSTHTSICPCVSLASAVRTVTKPVPKWIRITFGPLPPSQLMHGLQLSLFWIVFTVIWTKPLI